MRADIIYIYTLVDRDEAIESVKGRHAVFLELFRAGSDGPSCNDIQIEVWDEDSVLTFYKKRDVSFSFCAHIYFTKEAV